MKIDFEHVLKWCQFDAPDKSCEKCQCTVNECAECLIEAIKDNYEVEEV